MRPDWLSVLAGMGSVGVARLLLAWRDKRRAKAAEGRRFLFFMQESSKAVPDGLTLEGGDGRRYEVVRPRWWQLLRWLGWHLSPGRVKGIVVLGWADGLKLAVKVRELEE